MEVKPTMQDVADLAQVSRATVSRVLADSPNVSQDKRAQVLEAVRKLGYKPHKKLRPRYQMLICISPTQKTDPFHEQILDGIQDVVRTYKLKLSRLQLQADSSRQPHRQFPPSMAKAVSQAQGLIILGNIPMSEQQYLHLHQNGIPTVIIYGIGNSQLCSYVGIDERRAMIEIVSELMQLGHKNIAYIHGPEGNLDHRERLRAFKLGVLSAHLADSLKLIIQANSWDRQGGYEAAVRLLTSYKPSAIITANDLMALGAYRAVKEAGFRIPEDVSVVGFGDLECAKNADPPLSTIAVPLRSIGKWAAALLHTKIVEQELAPVRLTVPTVFRQRDSTAQAKMNNRPRTRVEE